MSLRHTLNILKEGRRQEKDIEYEDLGTESRRDIHALRANAPDAVELNGGLERLVEGKKEKGEGQKVLELAGAGEQMYCPRMQA